MTKKEKATKNPLTGKMEVLSKVELKAAKLMKKAIDGDTESFKEVLDIAYGPVIPADILKGL